MKPRAAAWGVQRHYRAAGGTWQAAPAASVDAVLRALGANRAEPEQRPGWPLVVRSGTPDPAIDGQGEIELENGGSRPLRGGVPADLPLGYHRLHLPGRTRPLIVVPDRCHLPADMRGFGFAVQLYATRSAQSWGIGDLADLAGLGRWATGLGARVLLVNPLHAALPIAPVERSPYLPTSRLFRNPLDVRIEAIPGVEAVDVEDLRQRGRALDGDRRIDRDAVIRLKLEALQRLFDAGAGGVDIDAGLDERPLLGDFALFCALAERHGRDWRAWPEPLRQRRPAALAEAGVELRRRVRFHAWIQVLLDAQFAEAAAGICLLQDLAVGVDPAGVDAWIWQSVMAQGVTVGVPPDLFNTRGQDWSLPPFDPWKLRDAGYAPFVETLRANLRHGGGIRIDHVMGLRRLWWIPPGLSAAEGAYVEYPDDDLLGIVALESVRHGAIVVGEDLGTVQPLFRRKLRRRGLLSYLLLLFEDRPPERWPRQALAAVTTHDLPTIAGLWDGSDLETQRRLGLAPNVTGTEEMVERIRRGGPQLSGGVETAILHAYRQLAGSPCMILTATLEDVAGLTERPNHPGTGPTQNPNWSVALPMPREELQLEPMAERLAALLRRG